MGRLWLMVNRCGGTMGSPLVSMWGKNCVVQSMLYGSPWDQAEVSLQLRPYLHLVPLQPDLILSCSPHSPSPVNIHQ